MPTLEEALTAINTAAEAAITTLNMPNPRDVQGAMENLTAAMRNLQLPLMDVFETLQTKQSWDEFNSKLRLTISRFHAALGLARKKGFGAQVAVAESALSTLSAVVKELIALRHESYNSEYDSFTSFFNKHFANPTPGQPDIWLRAGSWLAEPFIALWEVSKEVVRQDFRELSEMVKYMNAESPNPSPLGASSQTSYVAVPRGVSELAMVPNPLATPIPPLPPKVIRIAGQEGYRGPIPPLPPPHPPQRTIVLPVLTPSPMYGQGQSPVIPTSPPPARQPAPPRVGQSGGITAHSDSDELYPLTGRGAFGF